MENTIIHQVAEVFRAADERQAILADQDRKLAEKQQAIAEADAYAGLDYDAMIQEFGITEMSAGELASVFPDAHRAIWAFGAQSEWPEVETIGNSPAIIRALGKLGADLRIMEEAETRYLQELPPGTKVEEDLAVRAIKNFGTGTFCTVLGALTFPQYTR